MRFIAVVLITCFAAGLALAESSTQPASAPATTQAANFPTPAELLAKMKEMRKAKEAALKVAYIDLSTTVVEKPADFSLFGGETDVMTLRSLISRLHQARDDQDVKAVLITIGAPSIGLAQAQEVREALVELRRAGKKTFVYADSYDTATYTLATGATDICLLEGGEILIPGVGGEAMFAKGLLDKIGVKADYVQIGEYKGADEQYTRTGPSEELRGEMNRLMDALYAQIVDGIASHRNITTEQVKTMIDESMLMAEKAKEQGYVDHLVDQDGLRDLITKHIGGKNDKIDLLHRYGLETREAVDFSNPFGLLAALSKRPAPTTKPAVALIYADGTIIDGQGGEGMFGNSVGSDDMRRALRMAARDENIKAVVIRIDSPGGSALASEVMWQAARRVAGKKPLVISIGSMAASGGYYLASAGDYIFADPAGIVGSIGVVGGKFVMRDLFDKLGLTTESFMRGKNAGLFSSNQPFDEAQRKMITSWMRQTYDQFTHRVMETRKGKIKDIDQVARGRIFIAKAAKELGMVDELGGVEQAIAYAADRADLKAGGYDVRVVPAPRTLADFFGGGEGPEAAAGNLPVVKLDPTSLFAQLAPGVKRALGQHVWLMRLLEDRPVTLMAPFVITTN
ncbi:MAG TPA: signal peptide peptidase SppA [Tepidisphaeraceae bacterium]|nr:signal peptide peptidase SppA [Tepidisphaeraceae bacterium]